MRTVCAKERQALGRERAASLSAICNLTTVQKCQPDYMRSRRRLRHREGSGEERAGARTKPVSAEAKLRGRSERRLRRSKGSAKWRLREAGDGSGEVRAGVGGGEAVPERSGAGAKQVPERAINSKKPRSGNRFVPRRAAPREGSSGATGDERTAPRRDGSGEGTKPVPERSGAGSEEDGRTRKRTGRPVVSPLPSVRESRRPVSMASNLSAS